MTLFFFFFLISNGRKIHAFLHGWSQNFSECSHRKVSAQPNGLSCLVMWKEPLAKFTTLILLLRQQSHHVGTGVKHKTQPFSKGLKYYKIFPFEVLQRKKTSSQRVLAHSSYFLFPSDQVYVITVKIVPSRICQKEKAVLCYLPFRRSWLPRRGGSATALPHFSYSNLLQQGEKTALNLPHHSPPVSGPPDCYFCCYSLILQSCKVKCNSIATKTVSACHQRQDCGSTGKVKSLNIFAMEILTLKTLIAEALQVSQ